MRTELFKTRGGFTLGELLVVFAVVFLLIAAFTPIIRFSNERMDKVECANNLREIGLAMYIYAREHGGGFPPTLEKLYEENYLGDRRTMKCPAAHAQGVPDEPDYLYTPNLSARDRSDLVLVRDRKGNHPKGGGNVLYVDGTVEWEDSLQAGDTPF